MYFLNFKIFVQNWFVEYFSSSFYFIELQIDYKKLFLFDGNYFLSFQPYIYNDI